MCRLFQAYGKYQLVSFLRMMLNFDKVMAFRWLAKKITIWILPM
ncbi:hypothetical protein MTR67_035780 [Solanum verrucosum]|uniref:Uncharacterized protein n=1 Tax=Solanum verrucosum TaxID=315347 RepID=A0AAF0ZLW8_SOLVR|nr:hypothetical protein MTR67_035780 [Solanum verrucosum]